MNIVAYEDDTGYAPKNERWYALDSDTYDGAEDSRNRNQVGHGATEDEAIVDLLDMMLDKGEITEREHRHMCANVGR